MADHILQNELKALQDLSVMLTARNYADKPGDGDFEKKATDLIAMEVERIKEALTAAIFATVNESIVERYIQHHQTGIIECADKLNSSLSAHLITAAERGPETGDEMLVRVLRFFLSRQFDLLNYIERFFSRYFNLDATIPEAYRVVICIEMAPSIELLLSAAGERIKPPELTECILSYLRHFRKTGIPSNITFRELIYFKLFISDVGGVMDLPPSEDWETNLLLKLIYLNFNNLAFFNYYRQRINEELEEAESAEQYMIILSRALSIIKGVQSKPGFSYHNGWPEIKTMLETWLNDEISLAMLPYRTGTAFKETSEAPVDKLVLNLSVAHIACIIKLFYEESVSPSSSITELFKFVVKHFRSKRQEKISTGSLSKEYYSIGQKTAAQVLDLLQRMIARINKTYFPVMAAIYLANHFS